MAYNDLIPGIDASQGLIYRLNILWMKTDYAVLAADYMKWDVLLDRIYANLLYREDMEIIDDVNKKIISVELSNKDKRVYMFLSKKIFEDRSSFLNAKNARSKSESRSKWYHACQKKDIWLRKLMYRHNLYLREAAKTPGQSLFGTFGKKKKGFADRD